MERRIDVAEERLRQVVVAEAAEDEPVERHEALEGCLLAGLEGALVLPLLPRPP